MKTALLIIDAQKIYTDPESELYCPDSKATMKRINQICEFFEKRRFPVFIIRHIHKKDGSDLGRMFDFTGEPEEDFNFKEGTQEIEFDNTLHKPQRAVEIVKNRYSAFRSTELDSRLKAQKVKTVVICGFMTNFCCESTARDAHDLDYFVDFITDATGTPGTDNLDEKEIRRIVSELLSSGFARVSTAKKFLKALSQ
jgi:ureidoacrylate peracid hydrolase